MFGLCVDGTNTVVKLSLMQALNGSTLNCTMPCTVYKFMENVTQCMMIGYPYAIHILVIGSSHESSITCLPPNNV